MSKGAHAASRGARLVTKAQSVAAAGAMGEADELGLPVLEPFGRGLARDVRNRLVPYYASDWTDGLTLKSIAASGFLFCACLCVAVAFGGLLSVLTAGEMGAIEMIISTSVCGVIYSFTCGQPVAISGFGGAHLAFTGILYGFSKELGIAFLPFYSWVGIWTTAFLALMTFTSVSNLVLYFTRWTDETFSALSSIIFCYESTKNLVKEFTKTNSDPAQAFLAVLTALFTFFIVQSLTNFRKSVFLTKRARDTIADFAPTIGIICGTLASIYFCGKYALDLPTLLLPAGLATSTGRAWIVDIWAAPLWVRWGASVPAVFAAILLFMDQVITTRLVNSPDNQLKKGYGYHLDLLVITALTGMCSILGLPWVTAATVPSLNHARSLAEEGADGLITGIQENRLSNTLIHSAIGLSVLLLRPYLLKIPTCVFMGLFLFLGVSAAGSNKLVQRAKWLVADPEKIAQAEMKPKKLLKLPLDVVKKYTVLQLCALAALWFVKSSKLGFFFPVLVVLLVPARLLAGRYFLPQHLEVLDDCGDALEAGREAYNREVVLGESNAVQDGARKKDVHGGGRWGKGTHAWE